MTKKCSSKRLLFPWRRQPFSSISILDMLPLIPILWSILSVHAQNDAATTKIQDVSVPTYTLGPFNFSVSYRQDVCDRQAAFHAGNVTLRDALEGFQLRPYFLTGIPTLSSTDDDGSIPINTLEPSIRILDQLATRAKLTWRNSYGASSYVDALTIEQQQEQQQQQSESNRQNFDPYKANFDNVLNWATQSFDMSGNGEFLLLLFLSS
ncbi:hypothetical protein IV203_011645 [Nitzschia inconspicua]|uniref:Uncharacterized protein n=1 Tax=Nitzschia inconspicua TaxID=303405 RepID=A0A9K3PIV0_9STRA|nr:hypothetical protein IV203_011645 [Nitzschia inconspicua]